MDGGSGLTDDQEREGKAVSEKGDKPPRKKSDGDDIGKALRTAYDRTVNEDVPPELLDLLGKLK